MTLMLGGPLHGQDIDVKPVPQTALEIVTNRDPVPSPSYVDIRTGEQYLLRPVGVILSDPTTGQPAGSWESTVYAHVSIGNPELLTQALQHAVLAWWFTTRGTRSDLPAGNGHMLAAAEHVLHLAWCDECDALPDGPIAFATPGGRAKWMVAHAEATGHKPAWKDEKKVEDPAWER